MLAYLMYTGSIRRLHSVELARLATRTAIVMTYVCCLCLMAFQNDALGSKLVEDGFVTRDVPFRAD